jgi:hypothetical protein
VRLILFCPSVSLLCACFFLIGCSAYRLGSPTEIPFDSLYILPTQNSSFAPQAQQLLSSQIRKSIIRDGRLSLANNPDKAAARLEIELIDYQRNSSAYSSDDVDVARSYSLLLLAKVSLWDARKNAYLFKDRTFQVSEQSYLGNPFDNSVISANNFNAAEYNSMPLLTRSLAEKISDHVLSPW